MENISSGSSFVPANRLNGIELSPIVQIQATAGELRAQGVDVIGLGTGEPDFDTPDHIKEAAIKAIRDGDTKYPLTGGTAALKKAIVDKFARENALEFVPPEVIVCTGAKQVLFNAIMASVNPGDEVIIPTPYWGVYSDIVRIAGGVPVMLACGQSEGFRLTPSQLEEAINPRTGWVMLNYPNNPSGAAYDLDGLAQLLAVLEAHPHVWVLSDEIYEHLVYDGIEHASVLAVAPWLRDRCLTVNGVSKAYAMTGWRIGYAAGPAEIISSMVAVQGHVTSGASSISQAAAVAALNGPQEIVRERGQAFQGRRDLVVGMLNQASGIDCANPEGAFYVFPSCEGVLGRRKPNGTLLSNEMDFCEYLLKDHGVAVVPGAVFGSPGHFRISYAYAETALEEACRRIQTACGALRD